MDVWRDILFKYKEYNCDKMGRQKTKQLSNRQMIERNKLMKRVRKGEIVISPSEKGKGIVGMPIHMYENMVLKHTEKDPEVEWKQL